MSAKMTDPHSGLLSFQDALRKKIVRVDPVRGYEHMYSHFDQPAAGVKRCTYARLSDDRQKVLATGVCVFNGYVGSAPCVSLGYAVAQDERGKGLAKQILADVIQDQCRHANGAGLSILAFEVMIDVTNLASIHVAESVFGCEREELIDKESGVPAYRYTMVVNTENAQRIS